MQIQQSFSAIRVPRRTVCDATVQDATGAPVGCDNEPLFAVSYRTRNGSYHKAYLCTPCKDRMTATAKASNAYDIRAEVY